MLDEALVIAGSANEGPARAPRIPAAISKRSKVKDPMGVWIATGALGRVRFELDPIGGTMAGQIKV
jgi:hypothetical protein